MIALCFKPLISNLLKDKDTIFFIFAFIIAAGAQ